MTCARNTIINKVENIIDFIKSQDRTFVEIPKEVDKKAKKLKENN